MPNGVPAQKPAELRDMNPVPNCKKLGRKSNKDGNPDLDGGERSKRPPGGSGCYYREVCFDEYWLGFAFITFL